MNLYPGQKSNDEESLAYIPTLFCFTDSPAKRQMERNLERWKALQERRRVKASLTSDFDSAAESSQTEDELPIDSTIVTDSHRSLSVQTDLTMLELHLMEHDYQKHVEELHVLQERNLGFPTEKQLEATPDLLSFYTGLGCFTILMALFEFVAKDITQKGKYKLSKFQCFLLTLMKLRLNLSYYDLGFRFGVCRTTVARIFKKWIYIMNTKMSESLIKWPDRDAIQRTTPFCFRVHYGLRVTAIIDCFELFIEKPSSLFAKACTWSSYKHYNTAKYLIAITPQGVISFISNGWGGRASDQYITENCGFLRHIYHGDVILADRGFLIEEAIGARGASLCVPAFTKGKDQLSAAEVEKTRNIANVRIHVERIIGCVRQRFTILSATGVLPKEYFQQKESDVLLLDAIVKVCCALNNMCEPIVPFE